MGCSNWKMSTTLVLVMVLLMIGGGRVKGQPTPSCVSNLIPCYDYLNTTNPPPSCCVPLREAVTTQLACLCNLYANPALLAQFNISLPQALALPGYCGIPADISACNNAIPPTSSSVPPPPPGVPGNDGNRVGIMAWTVIFGLLSCSVLL